MTEELARNEVIGWLRNPPRKNWSLCIPYELGGSAKPMYPDFLIIRSISGHLVIDVLEPHRTSEADAPAKAAGLAKFAAKHGHEFGRIEYIIIDDDVIKRLDLCDERIRNRVKGVQTHEHLRQLLDAD